ncbi:MAG: hypothetical protein QJR02_07540 [Sinobacteraceae bacterium]|nr:hypothetical protein [Nevskiaceae bacterium]
MHRVIQGMFAFILVCLTGGMSEAWAQSPIQPYVLAYTAQGDLSAEAEKVKSKLVAAGFAVLGAYSPYSDAWVAGVTNDAMKQAAAKDPLGAFAAVEHVAITKVGGALQVTYLNPEYMAAAYQLTSNYADVLAAMQKALGAQQMFGTKEGRTPDQLREYHYMLGMEYFKDVYKLGHHNSYEDAVKTVDANLRKGVGGAALVYRLEIPGRQQTLFGVSRANVTDQRANDRHIMQETVDQMFQIKTTAYLPYDMLVNGQDVVALHMRFRMAVWHPDLTMGTFGKLITSPGAIEELLTQIAGGKKQNESLY